MNKALNYIVSSIVEHPEKVGVSETEEDSIINFVISVDKEDIGKIIGKEGKIIRAIRNVMKIPAIKQNKRINITLKEETE